MPWNDRVRQGAYTSPSGSRILFDVESVGRSTGKRTTAFEFGGVDGAYVQDNGFGARSYPLECIFHGDNHDVEATLFEFALLERGEGRLEHPFYGTFDVVPFGDIGRTNGLVRGANQTTISVTFMTSIGTLYPSGQVNAESDLYASLGTFTDAAALEYGSAVALANRGAEESAKTTFRQLLNRVQVALEDVARATPSVQREFNAALNAIDIGMNVLIATPASVARQSINAATIPARAQTTANVRLEAYRALAEGIYQSAQGRPDEAFGNVKAYARRRVLVTNDFLAADVLAMGAMAGAISSAAGTKYIARPHAIAAAAAVLTQFDGLVAWRDNGNRFLELVDVGGAYQALQSAVATAAGYLVEMSFSLLPERRVVIDRPRAIVELCAELYGSADEKLDFLISTNELTGSEILEVPAGREITYYA